MLRLMESQEWSEEWGMLASSDINKEFEFIDRLVAEATRIHNQEEND